MIQILLLLLLLPLLFLQHDQHYLHKELKLTVPLIKGYW